MSESEPDHPLTPDQLAARLAEVYLLVGPLYRKVLRVVERDEPVMGMSVGVRAVLDQLRRFGELTVPDIARRQDLSRQFVQRMVNDALALGWVRLADNPAHKRSSLVRITPAGATAIGTVVDREHRMMTGVGGDLTAPEVDATLRVLGEMLAALERIESGEPGSSG